jgi:hypothetical protein
LSVFSQIHEKCKLIALPHSGGIMTHNYSKGTRMSRSFKISFLTVTTAAFLFTGCQSTLKDLVEVRTLNDNGKVVAINGKRIKSAESGQEPEQEMIVSKQEADTTTNETKSIVAKKNKASRYNQYTIVNEYGLNVDLVARAIQRQFNFQSPEQIRRQNGALAADFMIRANDYRWETSPGAFYNFRRSFTIQGLGYNIDFEIVRLGDGKSNVAATYWVKNEANYNQDDVQNYIKNNLHTALSRYL